MYKFFQIPQYESSTVKSLKQCIRDFMLIFSFILYQNQEIITVLEENHLFVKVVTVRVI